jgi:hypothetical protein
MSLVAQELAPSPWELLPRTNHPISAFSFLPLRQEESITMGYEVDEQK